MLLYRHECFTRKYTTRKIHTKLHPGLEWRVFHILTSKDIDDFTYQVCVFCKLYLNSFGYDRNIVGSSLKVFGNFRQSSENVQERSFGLRSNFGKSSESGRKPSENRQKRRHQYVYILVAM